MRKTDVITVDGLSLGQWELDHELKYIANKTIVNYPAEKYKADQLAQQ